MSEQGASKHVNLLIIGAAKCGTTTVHRHLASLRGAYFSPLKEPNFHARNALDPSNFSRAFRSNHRDDLRDWYAGGMEPRAIGFVRSLSDYDRLFEQANPKEHGIIGEASTSTLFDPLALDSVAELHPEAKVLVVLRNPVDRMHSHWGMAMKYGFTELDFRQAVEKDMRSPSQGWGATELFHPLGLYAQQLKPWIERWPQDRMRVLLTEDLANRETWESLSAWLGATPTPEWLDQVVSKEGRANVGGVARWGRVNRWLTHTGLKSQIASTMPKSLRTVVKKRYYTRGQVPSLSPSDRTWALGLYLDEVNQLEQLIGRDLPDWKR